MTMVLDSQRQQFGLTFDHMGNMPYQSQPHFTNPWASSTPAASHSLYAPTHNAIHFDSIKPHSQQQSRLNSNASYTSLPISSASAGSPHSPAHYSQDNMLTMQQDLLSPMRMQQPSPVSYANDMAYSSAPSAHSTYAASTTPYDSMGYAPAPMRSTYAISQDRRMSQTMNDNRTPFEVDASRGMIAMSQTTPRNAYAPLPTGRMRGSGDSYGLPAVHSTSSSISSASTTYPSYFGGSVDSAISDYSASSSDMDSVASRTLPRPTGLMGMSVGQGIPPAPQSMMGQFSSKISSSTQKKHKCKVCDKRFTRPSSLQTHMYSHTGEKPFSCESEGCGRKFSVVSNLRRHRKVHRGEARSEVGSEDHDHDHNHSSEE